MPFKREWDSSCPHVYDQWEADGVSYVIQDLPPEDEEEALNLLLEHFLPDELLCSISGFVKDPESTRSFVQCWRSCFKHRMTLACYAEENGVRTLAALNCCFVQCQGEKDKFPSEGAAWLNVYSVTEYIDENLDAFKYLDVDKLLYALGLVVRREYRGAKLGARVLAAREPLARSLGIKGSSTVFSGPGQKAAAKAGFTTVYEVTLKQLADAGMSYPKDDRIIKLMVKKYN